MKKQQSGFTLIELVVVIVILGILAATAVPRFANLTADAETAVANGVVGAVMSTAAIRLAENQGTASTWADIAADTTVTQGDTTIEVSVDGGTSFEAWPGTGSCQTAGDTSLQIRVGGTSGSVAAVTMPLELCNG